jgi:hypothetical protein
MPQTITDGAGRQIPLSGTLFSANAANFRPAKSRLITTVRAIAHVTSVRVEIRTAGINFASTFWKVRANTFQARPARAMKHFAKNRTRISAHPANEARHLGVGCIDGLLHSKLVFFPNENQICKHLQLFCVRDK